MKDLQFRIHATIGFILISLVLYMKVFMDDEYSNFAYIVGGITIIYLVVIAILRIKEMKIGKQ